MVSVKFNDEEKEMLDELVSVWTEEAADMGTLVTASSLIRALVRREARDRGIDKPGKARKGSKK
jgi:hypothetical protein